MKELNELALGKVMGGSGYDGDLLAYLPTPGEANITAILALLAPSHTVHYAD